MVRPSKLGREESQGTKNTEKARNTGFTRIGATRVFSLSSFCLVLKDEKETDEGQTWATVASGKYKISNNK